MQRKYRGLISRSRFTNPRYRRDWKKLLVIIKITYGRNYWLSFNNENSSNILILLVSQSASIVYKKKIVK